MKLDRNPSAAQTPSQGTADDLSAFSVAVIGDIPYGISPSDVRQIEMNPRFVEAINADRDVSMVVHIGDIHAGKQYCTQPYNAIVAEQWKAFKKPLVYTPGDNEWMDCHKVKKGGGSYNKATEKIDYVLDSSGVPVNYAKGEPLANLALVRSMFFPKAGQTLGVPMSVHSQALEAGAAHSQDKAFVENVWWERGGVLFVTLNIPGGSNNGTDPWYGTPTMGAEQQQEVAERSAATLRWIESAYSRATKGHSGMVILTQADMWDVDEAKTGAAHLLGYKPYLNKIAEGAKAYGMPVLMITGDSHFYRSDNPLLKDAACVMEVESGKPAVPCTDKRATALMADRKNPSDAYLTQAHGYTVPNFHGIVVHGETLPMEWLNLQIDPQVNAPHGLDAFGPFRWKRVQPPM